MIWRNTYYQWVGIVNDMNGSILAFNNAAQEFINIKQEWFG